MAQLPVVAYPVDVVVAVEVGVVVVVEAVELAVVASVVMVSVCSLYNLHHEKAKQCTCICVGNQDLDSSDSL